MIPDYKNLEDISQNHNEMHRKLHRLSYCILPDITTSVPTINTLDTGYSVVYISGSTYRLYMNINGTIYYFGLTAA